MRKPQIEVIWKIKLMLQKNDEPVCSKIFSLHDNKVVKKSIKIQEKHSVLSDYFNIES